MPEVAVNWLGECGDQLAANVSDYLACCEWQTIGWASVAISLHTGVGSQLDERVWRSAGVLGMAINWRAVNGDRVAGQVRQSTGVLGLAFNWLSDCGDHLAC